MKKYCNPASVVALLCLQYIALQLVVFHLLNQNFLVVLSMDIATTNIVPI